ncbi:MAG: hypothetical protein K0S32_3729 [Bacteroidetes bacterium]|jgi:hypothetical protein|nr:hypothetical protein [Bacteroidota bacterium]
MKRKLLLTFILLSVFTTNIIVISSESSKHTKALAQLKNKPRNFFNSYGAKPVIHTAGISGQ